MEHPFLNQIIDDPADDDARLVYADYLEESGDPRGEFIRVQCALAKTSDYEPEYYDLLEREDQLLEEYFIDWTSDLEGELGLQIFERGFIPNATTIASKLLKTQGKILQQAPLEWLRLTRMGGKELAALPALSKLYGLDLAGLTMATEHLNAFFNSPHLTNLRQLRIDHIGAAEVLKKSGVGNRLKCLETSKTILIRFQDFEFTDLVSLRYSDSWAEFDIFYTEVEHFDDEIFAGTNLGENAEESLCFQAPKLRDLELLDTVIEPNEVEKLQVPWNNLRKIQLGHDHIPNGTLREMSNRGAFQSVEELHLNFPPTAIDLKWIFSNSQLANCKRLTLNLNSADLLTQSPQIENLTELSLTHLMSGELAKLVNAAHLQTLKSLRIFDSEISSEDIVAIANSPLKENLLGLALGGIEFGVGAIKTLLDQVFPNLVSLDLRNSFRPWRPTLEIVPPLINGKLSKLSPDLRYLNVDSQELGPLDLKQMAKLDLPELRVLSFQNNKATQNDLRLFFEQSKLSKLFQLRLYGTISTSNQRAFDAKFGPIAKLQEYSRSSID